MKIKILLLISILFLLTSCKSTEERRKEYQQLGWTDETIERVLSKRIKPGMTQKQVKESWGKPRKINSTISLDRKRHEQWCYGTNAYIYFEGIICTTIQID